MNANVPSEGIVGVRRETGIDRSGGSSSSHRAKREERAAFIGNEEEPRLVPRVANHPFMIGLKPDFVKLLSQGAREKSYERDDMLFLAGEPADKFFLVIYGSVSLEFDIPEDRHSSVQTVEAGEVVGWSWMTPPYRWTSDARALRPTRVVMLQASVIRQVCNARPMDGYRFMLRLIPIVGNRLENARSQLLEKRGHRSHR
jgi:CRP-like cAMP-binding protein